MSCSIVTFPSGSETISASSCSPMSAISLRPRPYAFRIGPVICAINASRCALTGTDSGEGDAAVSVATGPPGLATMPRRVSKLSVGTAAGSTPHAWSCARLS